MASQPIVTLWAMPPCPGLYGPCPCREFPSLCPNADLCPSRQRPTYPGAHPHLHLDEVEGPSRTPDLPFHAPPSQANKPGPPPSFSSLLSTADPQPVPGLTTPPTSNPRCHAQGGGGVFDHGGDANGPILHASGGTLRMPEPPPGHGHATRTAPAVSCLPPSTPATAGPTHSV